jgi:ADP-heptose:LPS heptosyltransferase
MDETSWVKKLELVGKLSLAVSGACLLWRPGRRARVEAQLAHARKVLLVRVDNRVGEALLMTPLLTALAQRPRKLEVDVLVHARAVRVLEGHPLARRIIGLDRRRLALGAAAPGIAPLRAEGYDLVIDCASWTAASVTHALVSRLVGPHSTVIGPALAPVSMLHDLNVPPQPGEEREVAQRLHLLSPLGIEGPAAPLSFRVPRVTEAIAPLLEQAKARRGAVVNPGGRLGWRRVPPSLFAASARALLEAGRWPIITWGPGEEALAKEVVEAAPGAQLAPATTLDELAALMQACGLTVCNNTGPMHLSVAVGAPTLGFFLRMDMARWGHAHAPHRMVDLTPWVDRASEPTEAVQAEVASFAQALAPATAPMSGPA